MSEVTSRGEILGMIDIDEPLKAVPFSCFTVPPGLGNRRVIDEIYNHATIRGYLRNKHIFPRAADRFWNREFRKAERKMEKEENTELEHDLQDSEMQTSV